MVCLILTCSGSYAQEWKELVVNGNFEGTDFNAFSINVKDEGSRNLDAGDIVVDDNDTNNHYAKISTGNLRNTQFIITFSKPLTQGKLFKFSLKVKRSNGKHYDLRTEELGRFDFDKEEVGGGWRIYRYEGVVTRSLNGCKTITCTFDRSVSNTEQMYFDDITAQEKDPMIIEFADPKVKEICVREWDRNEDGELDELEAADVTSLHYDTFSNNQEITSFNELRYFTGLTEISYGVFYGCRNLTSVIIPDNVTRIGGDSDWMGAFHWCWNLTSVTLGNKVELIDRNSFQGCTALSSIDFPNSLVEIGPYAFEGCRSLNTLKIPSGINSIGDNAFSGCSSLTSIVVDEENMNYDSRDNCNAIIRNSDNTLLAGSANAFIPSTVNAIADGAFSDRSGLTSLTIPKSITKIGNGAFDGCGGLNSIIVEEGNPFYDSRNNCNAIIETATNLLIRGSNNTIIPNSVTKIGPSAFSGSSGQTSIMIPSSVENIGENAFQNCAGPNLLSIKVEEGNPIYDSRNNCNAIIETASDSLILGCKNTTIPDDVTIIGPYAFINCSGMSSISIPNSVWKIGNKAFMDCTNLTSVIIGNGIRLIESFAFIYCTNLQDFYCYAEQVPDAKGEYGNWAFGYTNYQNATLHVPAASIEAYRADAVWQNFGNIVALTDNDPKPTGISNVNQVTSIGLQYYTLDGKRTATPRRGLNLIRMKDGTMRKVVVK